MALPKYADIAGGPDGTNSAGHQYKNYGTASSDGTPGTYHIYYDGHVEFVPLAGSNTGMSGMPNSMQTSAAAALAPAPAPAAPNPTGGTEAPAAAAPTAAPAPSATSSAEQKPDNAHNWVLNTQDGPHKGQWYYEELHQASDGSAGFFHVYSDGTRVYVPKTPAIRNDGGVVINSMQTSLAASGGTAAPATSQSSGDGHETATVVSESSSTGVNHADGLHNTTGFSGNASELHSSTPAAATPADTSTAAVTTATPAAADTAPAADPSHIYTVVAGDNMWNIAQQHNMSLEQLQALNPQIEHPEMIIPGQEINLGNGEPVVAASSDSAPTFPTTSSYDSTTTQTQTAEEPRRVGVGGWSDGTSDVPKDPTHGIAAVAQANTDPLKINDNKPNAS